jgi:hypothetical protein
LQSLQCRKANTERRGLGNRRSAAGEIGSLEIAKHFRWIGPPVIGTHQGKPLPIRHGDNHHFHALDDFPCRGDIRGIGPKRSDCPLTRFFAVAALFQTDDGVFERVLGNEDVEFLNISHDPDLTERQNGINSLILPNG